MSGVDSFGWSQALLFMYLSVSTAANFFALCFIRESRLASVVGLNRCIFIIAVTIVGGFWS